MSTLTERLNLTEIKKYAPQEAVKIDARKDINFGDTLRLYCAENNIDLDKISESDFSSCIYAIEDYSKSIKLNGKMGIIYFWIDE